MATITFTIPDAWISEDDRLFVVADTYAWGTPEAIAKLNALLADSGFEQRLTMAHVPLGRRFPSLFVDPAFIASERWPESAFSSIATEDWVRVFEIPVDAIRTPDIERIGASR